MINAHARDIIEARKYRLLSKCMSDCFNYDNNGDGANFNDLADAGAVHPEGTGFKTEWCPCSSPSPAGWIYAGSRNYC